MSELSIATCSLPNGGDLSRSFFMGLKFRLLPNRRSPPLLKKLCLLRLIIFPIIRYVCQHRHLFVVCHTWQFPPRS